MSKFSNTSSLSSEKSLNFVIPIVVLLFIGLVYLMSQKADGSFVSFILIGVATITTIYWVRVLKKMLKNVKPKYTAREAEAKNWVYDLIKGENQFVFEKPPEPLTYNIPSINLTIILSSGPGTSDTKTNCFSPLMRS